MRRLFLSTSLLSVVTASAVFAADVEPLKGRAEVNWRAGSERAILMTELWAPLAQDAEGVVYGDFRIMGDDGDNSEINIGVGYREIVDAYALGRGIAGIHAWYDRRMTEYDSSFQQMTLGAEWLGKNFDILANAYIPMSDENYLTIPSVNPQGTYLSGTSVYVDTNGRMIEEPQHGFDIELGLELGQHSRFLREATDSVRIYGGGYYFNGPHSEDVAGWRIRGAADITRNIELGARFQRNDERGSQGFVEATFRFPFGVKQSYREQGLRARLDESPERDIDIVTGNAVTDTGSRVEVINRATGAPQEVLHVDNTAAGGGDGSAERPFNTLAAAQARSTAQGIIYVHRGDGTSAGQSTGITLDKTGQQLIGAGVNFVYDDGRFTTANGAGVASSTMLIPASAAPVITNTNPTGDGITVSADDITVAGVTVDGATRDGIVVRANGTTASAQNITIEDVLSLNNRIGIYLHGANSGAVSAMVQNSVTASNSQHGIAVYDDTDDTFEVDLGGGSMGSLGLNVLAGNTLEDLAVEYDGRTLAARNNWWGHATGPDTDNPSVGVSPQIYYGAPINDGLVGHWTFDTEWTTNTTAYDRSGQGNNGTMLGGLSLADMVSGQNGEALDFDGVDDRIIIHSPQLAWDGLSILMWHNIDPSNTSFRALFGNRSAAANSNVLAISSWPGPYVAYLDNSSSNETWFSTTHNALLQTWSNLAYTYENPGISNIYADSATPKAGPNRGTLSFSANSYIGGEASSSRYIKAQLDDTRIYNRALSASEVAELYRMDTSSIVDVSAYLTGAP